MRGRGGGVNKKVRTSALRDARHRMSPCPKEVGVETWIFRLVTGDGNEWGGDGGKQLGSDGDDKSRYYRMV